jgi:glycosyltransferase involved in cell wall biosynthesis
MAAVDVTVVIPTIPPRAALLDRAIESVLHQTMDARYLVCGDPTHTGSAATRNRALERVQTEWVLWLDDDDQLMPHAVQLLVEAQRRTGADVISGRAWVPQSETHAEPTPALRDGWVDKLAVQATSRLTVTSLMRTEQVRAVGAFERRTDPVSGMELDDYGLYWKLAEASLRFWRIPETTFIWNHHGANTSGLPDRW